MFCLNTFERKCNSSLFQFNSSCNNNARQKNLHVGILKQDKSIIVISGQDVAKYVHPSQN